MSVIAAKVNYDDNMTSMLDFKNEMKMKMLNNNHNMVYSILRNKKTNLFTQLENDKFPIPVRKIVSK